MPKEITKQFDEYGRSLHNFFVELADHPAITDTLDYVLGALYGLVQAQKLGFKDRSTQYVSVYRPTWRTMPVRSREAAFLIRFGPQDSISTQVSNDLLPPSTDCHRCSVRGCRNRLGPKED